MSQRPGLSLGQGGDGGQGGLREPRPWLLLCGDQSHKAGVRSPGFKFYTHHIAGQVTVDKLLVSAA